MRLCASLFRGVAAPLGCVIFIRMLIALLGGSVANFPVLWYDKFNKSEFIVLPLEKPCNIRRFRLSNPQTVCTFPCFFPYGLKQGKDFYSPLTTLSSSRAELRFASLVEWA